MAQCFVSWQQIRQNQSFGGQILLQCQLSHHAKSHDVNVHREGSTPAWRAPGRRRCDPPVASKTYIDTRNRDCLHVCMTVSKLLTVMQPLNPDPLCRNMCSGLTNFHDLGGCLLPEHPPLSKSLTDTCRCCREEQLAHVDRAQGEPPLQSQDPSLQPAGLCPVCVFLSTLRVLEKHGS